MQITSFSRSTDANFFRDDVINRCSGDVNDADRFSPIWKKGEEIMAIKSSVLPLRYHFENGKMSNTRYILLSHRHTVTARSLSRFDWRDSSKIYCDLRLTQDSYNTLLWNVLEKLRKRLSQPPRYGNTLQDKRILTASNNKLARLEICHRNIGLTPHLLSLTGLGIEITHKARQQLVLLLRR
jgi:hypothetical protein